jgi:outer membrane protein assembly factor BamB
MNKAIEVSGVAVMVSALALVGQARAAEWPAAAQVLKEAGVSAGLAVVVGTTDGVLEADLTNDGKMLVQGLALSDQAAAKARGLILAKKLYGLASVDVVKSAATLPYYDRIVNLLVADLDALGNGAPSKQEIGRVLGYEGVAYLKEGGKWVKTVKPTPKEVDNWGHYMYDASRNSVSKDLVVGPPNALRWFGGPTGRNPIGGPRTADGTFVQISKPYRPSARGMKGDKVLPWAPVDDVALWAKDVSSGVMLWCRVLTRLPARGYMRTSGYGVDFAETFVAAGGRVYIYDFTDETQVALKALNLRTGAVERVFDQSVVFRKADSPAPQPDARGRTPDWRTPAYEAFAETTVLVHDGKVVQALREKVFVMDAASGDVIWRKDAPAGTNVWKVLISGDRLIALLVEPMKERFSRDLRTPYVAVEAWQLKDGKPVWRFAELGGAAGMDHRRCIGFGSRDHHLLVPVENRSGKGRALLLLDARDGRKVWEKPGGMEQWTWAIIGERIWSCRGSTGGVTDLATGANLFNLGMPNTGNCSVGGGTPNFFMQKKVFFPVAQAGARDGKNCPFYYMRSITQTCGENLCPSYGSVYNMPPVCHCEHALSGTQAWYALQSTAAVADDQRLVRSGPAALGPVQRQAEALRFPGAFDWGLPGYYQGTFWRWTARGGTGRAIWLGYGLTETPPVEAGDLTLVAHVQEHRLAAVRDEKEVWNFVAGGRIGSPPVVHQGLAIFGCHDGYVYAVNVKDGSPAWRFLAAPADRRHVVMNQVESVWPVYGVVLSEGNLYFSAGKHAELDSGVHFYCLDPASGKMKWHVKWLSGLSSDRYTPREGMRLDSAKEELGLRQGAWFDPERNKRIINDIIEVRDGKVWLFEMPVVDLADPKDTILNPETLVPPQLVRSAGEPLPPAR